jgi:hypothetical protein
MPTENVAHRLILEPETQVGHGAHDPVIAPPGIFLRHPHRQPFGFLVNSGTTPGVAKLRSVELAGDELSSFELGSQDAVLCGQIFVPQ